MLKNYWTITVRTLRKQGIYSVINLVGLAIGVTCCVLIFAFIRSELAVNNIFDKTNRIYRIDSRWTEESMGLPETTLAPVGPILEEEYPEVVDQAQLYLLTLNLRHDEKGFRREAMLASPSLLQMFDLPLVQGDPATALGTPRSAVISEDLARTLFGTTDVLGNTIHVTTPNNGEQPYRVTGVWPSLPYNSVLNFGGEQYDLIMPPPPVSEDFIEEAVWSSWDNRYLALFVELGEDVSHTSFQEKLQGFIPTHAPEQLHGKVNLLLNPLRTMHLREDGGTVWRIIMVLSAVALLILLTACFNFVNLSTALSLARLKEVGVRKVLGAERRQLIGQFFAESILMSLLATLLGALLAWGSFQAFEQLVGTERVTMPLWDLATLAFLLGLALVVGLLAGVYPALFLSSFGITRTFSGIFQSREKGIQLRQVLVIGQFMAAFILLVGVYTISQQISYITNYDLGYEHDHILVIDSVPRNWTSAGVLEIESVREQLAQLPGMGAVSLSYEAIVGDDRNTGNSIALRRPDWSADQSIYATQFIVDEAYPAVYDLTLAAGRFFSIEQALDDSEVVINQATVRALGLEEGVGQEIVLSDSTRLQVIGVLDDFHFKSLHEPIRPLLFLSVKAFPYYRMLSLRFSGGRLEETLESVQRVWQQRLPGTPFEYFFVDQEIDRLYRSEQQTRQVVSIGAILALIVAGFGMFGLASLNISQRAKEIGIRKILGSSTVQLLLLLTKDFLTPILIALLLASPLAVFLLMGWLENFAYHIDLNALAFLFASLAAILTGLIAVSIHVVRAARVDPVEMIRHE